MPANSSWANYKIVMAFGSKNKSSLLAHALNNFRSIKKFERIYVFAYVEFEKVIQL